MWALTVDQIGGELEKHQATNEERWEREIESENGMGKILNLWSVYLDL